MMFSGVSGIGSGIGYSTGRTRRLRCCLLLYASSVEQVQKWDTTFYRNIRADAIRVS